MQYILENGVFVIYYILFFPSNKDVIEEELDFRLLQIHATADSEYLRNSENTSTK